MNVGSTDEYKDFSKDGFGAWRKAKKGHRGQIVYLDSNGKARVRPVYIFDSISSIKNDLRLIGILNIDFYQSGLPGDSIFQS